MGVVAVKSKSKGAPNSGGHRKGAKSHHTSFLPLVHRESANTMVNASTHLGSRRRRRLDARQIESVRVFSVPVWVLNFE